MRPRKTRATPTGSGDTGEVTEVGATQEVTTATVDQAEGPKTVPAAHADAGNTAPTVAAEPPTESEGPEAQVEDVHREASKAGGTPAPTEAPSTNGEEQGVLAPEVMALRLLTAWTNPHAGHTLIEEWMARPSFRKMVISRLVKKLR